MICVIALVVFALLAIFLASYRPLAAEAFDCVFRKVTFRKCRTRLDTRLKGQIVGRAMAKSQFLAKLLHKNFELFSSVFVILLLLSFGYSVYSGYNYYLYGNCYGPEENSNICIYDAIAGEKFSELHAKVSGEIELPTIDDDPSIGIRNAKVKMIEFGCYSCPNSREAQDVVNEIIEKYEDKILFVYRNFPIEQTHGGATLHSEAANCALEQEKFWEMHEKLFTEQEVCIAEVNPKQHIQKVASELGLNMRQFNLCLNSHKYKEEIAKDFEDGLKAGVHGTPTFFINDRVIIGSKPFKAFEKIIEEELNE